jgi:hypothetical protein
MDLFRLAWQSIRKTLASAPTLVEAVLATSPSGYWVLGEPSGTNANDEAGTQDGTYVNTPTLGVSGINGDATGATFVAASSQHVTVAHHANWDFGTGDYSLMFAMDIATWPAASQFVMGHLGLGAAGEWGLLLPSSANFFTIYIESTTSHTTAPFTVAGSGWHLYGFSCTRSASAELFVDGVLADSDVISDQSAIDLTKTATLYLGSRGSPSSFLDGSLGHLAIWKGTALSAGTWADIWAAV